MKKIYKQAIFGLALGAGLLTGGARLHLAFAHGDGHHEQKPKVHKVKVVIDGGYAPHQVKAKHGEEVQLTFVREEKGGCGETVRFPDLKETRDGKEVPVERTLQPGEKTTITFTPKEKGTLHFTCGMEMYKGSVVVK